MQTLQLQPGHLTEDDLKNILLEPTKLKFNASIQTEMQKSQQHILTALKNGEIIYGINTGLGSLAETVIPIEQIHELQQRMVLSHCAGVGDYLSDDIVRLILILKINSLAQGYSGVSYALIERLNQLLEAEIYPCIPEKGSVGASGDLAPLAHMSSNLLGEGEVRVNGSIMPAKQALEKFAISTYKFAPKEGLALINGTQVSTALAVSALFNIENLFYSAIVAGSLSTEAIIGRHTPFDERIHEVRGQIGQKQVAKIFRGLFAGSETTKLHSELKRTQDPYSIRCQPQVMGACFDAIKSAKKILLTEANAVCDNPLVFSNGDIISGGNFHAEPVAQVADQLAVSLAEIGALSERRIALLIDANMSGLPAFLVERPGLNSGFMLAQVTAAALASENKSLAHPASIDSIPTSANQEDHVSMATFAARRLHTMLENTAHIIGIELLASAQAIEFIAQAETSKQLKQCLAIIRDVVSSYTEDRNFNPDLEQAANLAKRSKFADFLNILIP